MVVKKKREISVGCSNCISKKGEIYNDAKNSNIKRCFCKARFFDVDVELMGTNCDFYKRDMSVIETNNNQKIGGI